METKIYKVAIEFKNGRIHVENMTAIQYNQFKLANENDSRIEDIRLVR